MIRSILPGLLLVCLQSASSLAAEDAKLPRVPDGFEIQLVAGTPLVQHPMMAGFDERGRLFIAESAGENLGAADLLKEPPNFIRMLEDLDGDGVFDKSTIFADKMTFPMGALWYRDSLYVASPPYIWRLRDTDDDGVADERTILVDSFGFSGNAASIHGCFLSPGGRIFWCDGRHGHEHFDENGQLTSKGKAARIFSCKPDGSDVRVHCGGGMDNPVEVDFTETGEVIGTVNLLQGRPRIDALVHWIENGVYPRADQGDSIAEFTRTGELISPIARLGHVAVSGTTRYRSDQFGPEYRDNFFISIFNTPRVIRSILTPAGSTFTSREEDFLVSDNPDFHVTDVLEDADGSLLVIDTGGWFRIGCPTSQIAKPEFHGAIYRVRKIGAHKVDDPRGQNIAWKEAAPEMLADLLGDSRPVVRERAIEELSYRTEFLNHLESSLTAKLSPTQKRNLIWAIQRSDLEHARLTIVRMLNDTDPSVRVTALRSLRENPRKIRFDLFKLLSFVESGTPEEKRNAAVALEHRLLEVSPSESDAARVSKALLAAYQTKPLDRHLEHALTHALIKVGSQTVLQDPPSLETPIALRNWLVVTAARDDLPVEKGTVLGAFRSSDPLLKNEAFGVLQAHPEWIPELTHELRQLVSSRELNDENAARIRDVVTSMSDHQEIQAAVREALVSHKISLEARVALLESLAQVLDSNSVKDWLPAIRVNLAVPTSQVLQPSFQLVQLDADGTFDAEVLKLFREAPLDKETKLSAVRAIAARLTETPRDLFEFLMTSVEDSENTLFSLRAAETLSLLSSLESGPRQTLIDRISDFSAHVLPTLSAFVRTSRTADLQSAYLARVLRTDAYDRLTGEELQAWHEDDRSERVELLLKEVERARTAAMAERKSQLDALARLLEGGIAQKGEQVFQSRRAACAGCHRIETQGGQIGPDLTRIGRIRTSRDLLESIVFPSASFARGYEPFTVVNDDGRVYNGVIQSETAHAIVLRTTDLKEYRIDRSKVEALKESSVSVMPQGIDKLLTPEELRDLIAYLSERK